jgi:transposase InsO family protein
MELITQEGRNKSIPVDMLCSAMCIPRATYYRYLEDKHGTGNESRLPTTPVNALNDLEKQCVLDLLHSEHFIDKTPYDVYYELMDKGEYYCSPRTMYRILAEHGETAERRLQRNHRDAVKPELIAVRPNEVWSWDITKLLGPTKWVYYHLYVIMDIFSRYVVGWLIADCESQELARKLLHETALKHGIQPNQLTIHSDNGPSMKSHTVSQLLEHLGVAKTHNRPYTSNDNPFSESQFKTLKYRPEFPVRCQSLQHAEAFCQQFFTWYNKEHYHSGIAWLTPESVHYQRDKTILEQRHAVLMKAFLAHPERFNHKEPQLKSLPEAVYINPPESIEIGNKSGQMEMCMAG